MPIFIQTVVGNYPKVFRLNSKHRSIQDFKFCENQNFIKRLLESFVLCDVQDDDIDGKLYVDKLTGQKWEVYEYDDFNTYREPYPKGIRHFPYLSVPDTIEVICSSIYDDEIKGACRLLLENEWLGMEFREQLLNEIEKRQINVKKKKYKLIFQAAELDNTTNKRDTLNKTLTNIEADYKYYLDLAERALRLKG
ncbi:MAG: hypothetical protein ACI8ZM_004532 [Crocinitomix sp.]|jgi:hypothetical protein